MKIVLLDAVTLGSDIDLSGLQALGDVDIYQKTEPEQVAQRIRDAQAIVTNKVRLNRQTLAGADRLALICVTATGYDCIDTVYCRERGIGVCNVAGYSTHSVSQLTLATVLHLATRMTEYRSYVHDGSYTRSGVANYLAPVWQELAGKTWGVIGGGGIGQQVAALARAFGCRVLMHRRQQDPQYEVADLDTLCRESDIITVHVPLTDQTRGMLSRERIGLMKKTAIVVNVARGAVADEQALADAVLEGRLGGLGVDTYSVEPFGADHPFTALLDRPNVCLTPHMAWSSQEARNRCLAQTVENIRAFSRGEVRSRVV